MTDALKEYARLKGQIKELEGKLEQIKPEVEEMLFEAEGETLATSYGVFKMTYVPRWKYSDQLSLEEKKMKEQLKIMKKQEELDGKAKKLSDGGRIVFSTAHQERTT